MDKKRGLLKGRKAQITVFMIVGIILLFSSALLFYIRGQVVGGLGEFVPITEEVPLEAQPIKVFVEDCVRKVATEALVQIGVHGGYVDPKDRDMSAKEFLLGFGPTDSDALAMFENENALIPYWWYLRSPNDCSGNCEFGSQRPNLKKDAGEPSIEGQIDKYITRNLKSCLNDFNDFKARGYTITELISPEPDTRVAEREIIVLLNYPLSIEQEGKKIDLTQFFTKIDINFNSIYEFATDITNSQIQMFFLELHTMDLISMYSWPSSTARIPPIADFTLGLDDYRIWTRTETQRKIESNVLTVGIPMLQIDQSRNFVRRVMVTKDDKGKYKYDRIGQGLMDKSIVILNSSKNYTNIDAGFSYLDWWPIYLNINDREVLGPRSTQGTDLLSFFGVNEYRFWYDVSFPVLVTLRDPDAFEGRGYTFMFALEGNIRDNNHTSPTYAMLAKDSGRKQACNLNQRNSGLVTVETKDVMTGSPVPARVDFVLGNEACFIGFTTPDADGRTVLSANFPVGWGALRVNNASYLVSEPRYVTRVDQGGEITVNMMPFRYINASVFKKGIIYEPRSKKYVLPGGAPLSPLDPVKEKALITFRRTDNDTISEFTTFLSVTGAKPENLLRIIPGTYEVRGFLFYESNTSPITVKAEQVTFDGLFGMDTTVNLNETIINPYPKGGLLLNNETGYLKVEKDDLFGSNKIIFYVLSFSPPSTHSESFGSGAGLEQLSQVGLYSNIYRTELEPDWVTK